ncbi:UDP-N-acetylmuramoyl-L-alanyl-D-glutamate--2,6-diaminopimelate ligase [Helicobacter labetoulli]|uniref:UDP-N-acetylmuramoyl-L-alanyl-D-glutamate--2, 6-diaminopimelate ligase n=1 Tax=Helicobacter labetoulli TaxID=2315333 RepID=UPI000EF71D82|nr:UDP-N-acetylmuramoyl-L-alanyl-D-glutamate--2,6-diaminopimelate ligase [Helicobacter labetoulli]
MIIEKNINHNGKIFKILTDDTRVWDSADKVARENILLVRSKQNAAFISSDFPQNNLTESYNLSKVLLDSIPGKNPRIVGITGTNGKTTTAAIIYSLLLDLGYKVALLGTRGFFINDKTIKPKGLTTPSVLELYENLSMAKSEQCDFFVMEVSSHAIIQERIAGLEFELKILSNITSDHLDYHKSVEEYRRVKNSFFEGEGLKLINTDEKYAICKDVGAFYYGVEKKGHLSVGAYALESGIDAHIAWQDNKKCSQEFCALQTYLYGKHNLYNALAGIAAVKILTNKPLSDIAKAMENFAGVSGRMEVVHTKPLVIVDFAHTHDGMKQIFESFRHQKIAVVFGAGGDRDKSKRPKMGSCAFEYADKLYITSDNPRSENPAEILRDIANGLPKDYGAKLVVMEIDRKKAIIQALSDLQENEVLLILGKGDEDYQIIGENKIHFDDREVVRAYYAKE